MLTLCQALWQGLYLCHLICSLHSYYAVGTYLFLFCGEKTVPQTPKETSQGQTTGFLGVIAGSLSPSIPDDSSKPINVQDRPGECEWPGIGPHLTLVQLDWREELLFHGCIVCLNNQLQEKADAHFERKLIEIRHSGSSLVAWLVKESLFSLLWLWLLLGPWFDRWPRAF